MVHVIEPQSIAALLSCSLFASHCSLLTVRYSLLAVRCSLLAIRCSLLAIRCSLLAPLPNHSSPKARIEDRHKESLFFLKRIFLLSKFTV